LTVKPLIRRNHAEVRGDVEDHAAAARGHRAAEHLRAQHRASEAHGDFGLPLRNRKRLEARGMHHARRGSHLGVDRGVVDEDVDRDAPAGEIVGHRANRVQRGDIERGGNQFGRRIALPDRADGRIGLLQPDVGDNDTCAGLDQRRDVLAPEQAAGAGDQRGAPGQVIAGRKACHGTLLFKRATGRRRRRSPSR
jgi:hypothetical protein